MSEEVSKKSILEKFQMNNSDAIVWTLLYTLIGIVLFILVSQIPMGYLMVDLFPFGLLPALAIIPAMGAIRGPVAGFLTGYLGTVLFDLLIYGAVVTMTLPALGYGLLGLIAGLATYDLSNGRSLIKLTILSVVGFVFTLLIIVAVGLTVESYATLVVLGFVMLPLVTSGLPTIILLTPVYARIYHLLIHSVIPRIRPQ
jgi:energy-coupling factor transport system substrate-specific component